MQLSFFKYQGTGNDFVMIDNRKPVRSAWQPAIVSKLCDRRFGIGADGLILLQEHPDYDFQMVYFNADGREGSMCGNGGRCVVAFARFLGLIEDRCSFLAADGPHEARIRADQWVELQMSEVTDIEKGPDFYYLNTGSPHYITFVPTIDAIDVVGKGRAVRYSDRFKQEGTNVNFVQTTSDGITVATYERGVEAETLSCGTGVTAAAIAYHQQYPSEANGSVKVQTKGGQLEVRFSVKETGYRDVWLCGLTQQVFKGNIDLKN
ncbi:MAG: diaminopimelate epimerase [Saprospiraceae bacterium]|nr:MAG: diaminopimelate epimerase [Saprospiraceae bacterium]